jgi:uncharacterized cupredoxin-like copper-binding protein
MKFLTMMLAACCALAAPVALAHEGVHDAAHKAPQAISATEHAFGRQGDPARVSREIQIDMNDSMRFTPSDLAIRQGETIRFVVSNKGKVMHEMVLGSPADLKAHGEMMAKHPGMAHDEPYMAHVKPGDTQRMVWKFTRAGDFNFGCLAPGHFQAGMIGKIKVGAR